MRQQSILSKTITKLKPSNPKKIEHVSTKIQEERKTRRTKTPSTSKRATSTSKSPSSSKADTGPKLLREPKAYLQMQEVPYYEPTELEFSEPLLLLRNLKEKGYAKYGAVKFKAPQSWLSQFAFDPAGKNIITRKQLLKNMVRGKDFGANMDGYSLDEFKDFTDKFAREYVYHAPFKFDNIYRANEYEYWAHVEDPQYAQYNLTVEYAADLPSRKYGSGFPTVPGKIPEEFRTDDLKTHPFNLNNIGQARDALFQIITTKQDNISGISSPWVYLGMLFASFCWHVEDLYMYSVNYMHKGAPKTWYCIPEAYKEAFDATIKEKYGELFIMEPALMYNITQTMNPLELLKRNIPVYRTEQKPGEFIITFPKVYHAGISHGFNVAEAVNVATVDWIPYAKKAMDDYAADGFNKKGSFPYEWLILENVMRMSVEDVEFTKDMKKKLLDEYKEIVLNELECRKTVQKIYKRITIKKFSNTVVRYDACECSTCKNYTYLSFLSCSVCEKKACIKHITVCGCLNASIILNVRYTDQELEKYLPAEKRSSARNKSRGNKEK